MHTECTTNPPTCRGCRIRAAVAEMLADDEAALIDYAASLRADVAAYRALACAGLDHLAALTRRVDRLVAQQRELRDDLRRERAEAARLRALLMDRDARRAA